MPMRRSSGWVRVRRLSSLHRRAGASSATTPKDSGHLKDVREHELVALDYVSDLDLDRSREHRPGRGECVKLAVLAARIDPVGEGLQEPGVEGAARERAVELPGVDARDRRLEAGLDHFPCEGR